MSTTRRSDLLVRQGQPSDLPELQRLFVDTITTVCAADYDEHQIAAWASGVENQERWHDIITHQLVLVAQYADEIVGFATLHNGDYLDLLYVHKDYQRQGIAQRLLDAIVEAARATDGAFLTSYVSKTALAFFEKNGFRIVAEQTVSRKGVQLTNFRMEKKLLA